MRRMICLMLAAVLVLGSHALAQPKDGDKPKGDQARREGDRRGGDRRGGDRGRPRTPEEWQKRMEEFRKQMDERVRESLGASEDEWKVLKPLIDKVREIQRETRGGFRGGPMMFGGRSRGRGPGGRGPGGDTRGRPDGAPEREQSEIEKKTQALRSLLEDKASGAQAIKAALGALRKARKASEKKLADARAKLRSVVTMRQEAQLIMMGVLDIDETK